MENLVEKIVQCLRLEGNTVAYSYAINFMTRRSVVRNSAPLEIAGTILECSQVIIVGSRGSKYTPYCLCILVAEDHEL